VNTDDGVELWSALNSLRERMNSHQADSVATRLILSGLRNQLERAGILDRRDFDLLIVKVADQVTAKMADGDAMEIKDAVRRQLHSELSSADVVTLSDFISDKPDRPE
jgi:hypothetical protein